MKWHLYNKDKAYAGYISDNGRYRIYKTRYGWNVQTLPDHTDIFTCCDTKKEAIGFLEDDLKKGLWIDGRYIPFDNYRRENNGC